jgi:tricorn protease
MKNPTFLSRSIFLLGFVYAVSVSGINPTDTRLMTQPTISADHIAFIYAEDLWLADLDGANPRRLTVDKGLESNPKFSPDGKFIAFSAEYDGNIDVFIIPVEGGIPKRLTWHPGTDIVRDFTPDGNNVLFYSRRATFTNRYAQLFTVPVQGGYPGQLDIPNAFHADYSTDGTHIAYTPLSERFNQWKHYRGGTHSRIWLYDIATYDVVEVPQPEGGVNDTQPIWIGDQVYFRSDRQGEFNLYAFDTKSKEIKQLTNFNDFPVLWVGGSANRIIFEQAGYLHTYDIGSGNQQKLTIGIATDLLELRPRYVKGANYLRSGGISPTGARVVFDFRGDIITLPAEKGDPRNITETTGAHEKYPAWSPDGKSIAYFSDASGEYQLYIAAQDGKGQPKVFNLNGHGFYAYPQWSPDSKKIAFVDNSRTLYIIDVAGGAIKTVASDELYFPGVFREMMGSWSYDSQWLVYDKVLETNFRQVFLYSVAQEKSFPVSDGLSDATRPIMDPSGKYLYFLASTDAGPVVNWFDQSNNDMQMTSSIYLVTLQSETLSPLAKESDEEKPAEEKEAEEPAKGKKKSKSKATEPEKKLVVDIEGMWNRIIDLPVKSRNYVALGIGTEGKLLYQADGKLYKFSLKDRKEKKVMELRRFHISANGKKLLYYQGETFGITDTGKKPADGKGILNVASIEVKIDPVAEWKNIFDEAWRINRDYFYDPGMHGADWPALKKTYSQFLTDLSCRQDLNRVIQWMSSELSVGHHRLQGQGDKLNQPHRVGGGLLGVDFSLENSRYRFKKIYGGLNWTPDLRSPLTEPGINAKEGDYLLAVNGKTLTTSSNIYSYFENIAGMIVELTIGPNPDMNGSRVVKVVPLKSEYALRNRDWVEGNLKKVSAATNNQVAYVYVPNTAGLGHQYFKRYFFPQANRKAIIVDERFNGGGQLADYYINLLLKPYQANWNFRYGKDMKSPSASIQGPKVMIIDETAGSGGDMLPWMFRKFNVGTLVGKRTWGGLVGVLGFPEFIDGASVTAPNLAIWTKDGFIVENVGVPPDVEVEQTPKDVINGHDPQLEKAIEIVLKKLKDNPSVEPQRPPYPTKAKKN